MALKCTILGSSTAVNLNTFELKDYLNLYETQSNHNIQILT